MHKFMMIAFFTLVGGTFLSRIMEGAFFTNTDIAIMNSLTVFRTITVFGLFDIPWVNLDFFTVGLPHLFVWDMAFFGGGYSMFLYIFYVISNGLSFMLITLFIGVIWQAWKR